MVRRWKRLPLIIFALACPSQTQNLSEGSAVATVNGVAISLSTFERELTQELAALGSGESGPPSAEQLDALKRTLLDTLIERTLLLEAARELGVTPTPEEVDRRVLRAASDYPTSSFEGALAEGKTSLAELKVKTATLLTIEKLFEAHIYPRIAVTEAELREHYEQHSDDYQLPEQVRAAQLVVRSHDEAKALLDQLKSGKASFAELARRHSLSPDAKVGGDLGFFSRGVMPPEFEQAVFSLAEGALSNIVVTDYGFHIFKLLAHRAPKRRALAEVRAEVEQELLGRKRSQAERTYVQGLKNRAEIRLNEQVLEAVLVKR